MKKGFYGLNESENRHKKVIVSLTSHPPRLSTIHICLKSLLRQTYKPDKLILYLCDDVKESDLKPNVLGLVKHGLTIERVPQNLKPHKKYYYAMSQYPNEIIITVDDDLKYSKKLIEILINSYEKHPNIISASRVHKIMLDKNGDLKPYKKWKYNYREKDALTPSFQLFATGGAGTLYPPNCMDEELFNIENITNLCLNADDIWLKIMQIRKKTKVVLANRKLFERYILILRSQKTALMYSNRLMNANDLYLENVMQAYNIVPADFFDISGA